MILADEQISDPEQAGNTLWPLTDNLGSVRDVADYDDVTDITVIANHIVYDSFGNLASETNAAVDHLFGYTGRELDEESDFYFYRGRYYDPKTGRFASEDPIGFAAGDPNLNRYVGNNATGAVDPSGLVTGPLAGDSNVVDANGDPTGNVDCSGYVGGGGEGDYGDDCGTAEDSGYGTQWFNNDWTDWWNPVAYIGSHGYSLGDRIGTGFATALIKDHLASQEGYTARQRRALLAYDAPAGLDNVRHDVSTSQFGRERQAVLDAGLREAGEDAYRMADGAVASAELTAEVAMLVQAGAPAASSVLRSATPKLSRSIAQSGKSLVSPSRATHILTGDATGGGHKFGVSRLFNGKTKFPWSGSDEKILDAVSDVAINPNSKWVQQTGTPGSLLTKAGKPVKFKTDGVFDGVDIRVIVQGDEIITGFPLR